MLGTDSITITENDTSNLPVLPPTKPVTIDFPIERDDTLSIPKLSLFGRMFTRISNLVTPTTRAYYTGEIEQAPFVDDEMRIARQDIFSKKALGVLIGMRMVNDYRDDLV
jgi:hypothetical protein